MNTLRSLKELSHELASTLELAELAKAVNRFSVSSLGAETSSVVLASGSSYSYETQRPAVFAGIEQELFRYVSRVKRKLAVSSPSSEYMLHGIAGISGFSLSVIAVPLLTKNRFLGSLNLYFKSIPQSDEDEDLIDLFAALASSSLMNSLAYKSIETESMTDSLTLLYNRRCFDRDIKLFVEQCFSNKTPISFMMADIDNFKDFNDTKGHQAGDKALSAIGSVVSAAVKASGRAFRYGGEEIAVLLPGIGSQAACESAEMIRKNAEASCGVTLSIGLVTCMNSSCPPSQLVKEADIALYNAKNLGKNRVSAFLIIDKALGSIDLKNASELGRKKSSLS